MRQIQISYEWNEKWQIIAFFSKAYMEKITSFQ